LLRKILSKPVIFIETMCVNHTFKKARKRNYLLTNNLNNEAEGVRTLNLRIDSPPRLFVSPCGTRVNNCKLNTYETDGKPTKHQSSTKSA
jgi:hypothetical protein